MYNCIVLRNNNLYFDLFFIHVIAANNVANLGNLRNMAIDMGSEMDNQNRMIDRINAKVIECSHFTVFLSFSFDVSCENSNCPLTVTDIKSISLFYRTVCSSLARVPSNQQTTNRANRTKQG